MKHRVKVTVSSPQSLIFEFDDELSDEENRSNLKEEAIQLLESARVCPIVEDSPLDCLFF